MTVGETTRLVLRRLSPVDLDALCELQGDPEVMRYITGQPETRADIEASLPRILAWYERREALGIWAADLKDGGAFVGCFALLPSRDSEDVELGFRVLRRLWGKGYASEGAAWLLQRGFTVAGRSRVIALVEPGNAASRRVLEKIGMRRDGSRRPPDGGPGETRPVEVFAAHRAAS